MVHFAKKILKLLLIVPFLLFLGSVQAFHYDLSACKRYATYFGAGFTTQAVLNHSVHVGGHLLKLEPGVNSQQLVTLTLTGQAFASLPVMLTLAAAANLGVVTVAETYKAATEARAKREISQTIELAAIEEKYGQDLVGKEAAIRTAIRDRMNAYRLGKEAALTGARATFVCRAFTIGATALSIVVPELLKGYFEEPQKETAVCKVEKTVDERMLEILERQERNAYKSPVTQALMLSHEQMSFFAGQLVAAFIPGAWALKTSRFLKVGSINFFKNIKFTQRF